MHFYLHIILTVLICPKFSFSLYPNVSFPKGTLMGKYMTTRGGRQVEAYLGIPYAKPPVGDLRFQPPQPEDLILGDVIAQTMPQTCPQPERTSPDSEDCLYLNVFTPTSVTDQPLSVYFYIYGGEYFKGDLNDYRPDYLLDENIVLVTVQYRVGLFGLFSTGDEVIPGNMGLKDIRCGLRWVRDNIWRFGGDPTKVTIGGSSSGASTVHLLMIFMAHEGLFRAGIAESGSALETYTFLPPKGIKWVADVVANLSSCPRDSNGLTDCLKTKSVKDIVDILTILTQMDNNPQRVFAYTKDYPTVRPVLEPACVTDRIITGNPWHYNTSLPFFLGITSKECLPAFYCQLNGSPANFSLFDTTFNEGFPMTLYYQFSSADGSQVPLAFRNFYMANEPFSRINLDNSSNGVSDGLNIYPSFEAAMRAFSPNTFFYFFDYIGSNSLYIIPQEDRIGAVHVDEAFYIFPVSKGTHNKPTDADIQLSKKIVKIWTNFITYLDPTPNSTEEVKWFPFHPNQSYLHIKQDGMQVKQIFFPDRMNFWKSQPYPFRDDPDVEELCIPVP